MYIDKRILYIIIGVFVLSNVVGLLTDTNALLSLLLTLPAVLIAITFHEFAHAFAADKLGDDTPRRQDRLSLNPLKHLDPIGTVMLVFAHFGWGKPVEIEPRNFNRNISMTAGEAIVAAAGPVMNFILTIVFSIIYFVIWKFAPMFAYSSTIGLVIMNLLDYCIIINIGLGIFNLIPITPLDGSKILSAFLPYNARNWLINNQHIFYIIFIVLWVTGIAGEIVSPVINAVYNGIMKLFMSIFGITIF